MARSQAVLSAMGILYGLMVLSFIKESASEFLRGLEIEAEGTMTAEDDRGTIPCAWGGTYGPESDAPFLPDLNAYYHVTALLFSHKNEAFRARGRYFSYQTYETNFTNVAQIYDRQITPLWKSNPYLTPCTSENNLGGYEVYITPAGDYGFPNEIPAFLNDSTSKTSISFLAFRIYGEEPRRAGQWHKQWGHVDAPVLEALNSFTGEWTPIPLCSEEYISRNEQVTGNITEGVAENYPSECNACNKRESTRFSLYEPSQIGPLGSSVSFRNEIQDYLFWCTSQTASHPEFVLRITGVLPQTPTGLCDPITIADTGSYELRYVSFTTGDATPLFRSYQTKTDKDISDFYTGYSPVVSRPVYGAYWDRRYTIVVAPNATVARRCNLYNPDTEILMTFERGYLPTPQSPVVVMRELLHSRLGKKSASDVRQYCLNNRVRCSDEGLALSIMQDEYPMTQLHTCDMNTGSSAIIG